MFYSAWWRSGGTAVLAFALFSACADPPIVPKPTPDAMRAAAILVNKPPLDIGLGGEAWVCKEGVEGAGIFSFAVSVDGGVATNQSVAGGTCVLVHSVPTTGQFRTIVSVTEIVPTGFTLTGISIESNAADPSLFLPSINPPNASARISNDYGVVITFTNAAVRACTRTQGYWKNHPEDWDAAGDNKPFLTTATFFNSGVSYLTILLTPPSGGNAYLQLAHQYIAAVLNTGGGAAGVAAVDAAIAGAAAYFAGAPAGIPNPTGALRTQLQGWATTLDNFNNGVTGPGHCPEGEPGGEPTT